MYLQNFQIKSIPWYTFCNKEKMNNICPLSLLTENNESWLWNGTPVAPNRKCLSRNTHSIISDISHQTLQQIGKYKSSLSIFKSMINDIMLTNYMNYINVLLSFWKDNLKNGIYDYSYNVCIHLFLNFIYLIF